MGIDSRVTVDQHFSQAGVICTQPLEAVDLISVELAKFLASDVNRRTAHTLAFGYYRNTVLVRLTQYSNNLFVNE